MEFLINGQKLVWNFDKSETNAANLPENNLYIKNVWNMKETVGHSDVCVECKALSEDTFVFWTFNCLRFTMKIANETVICLEKQIAK